VNPLALAPGRWACLAAIAFALRSGAQTVAAELPARSIATYVAFKSGA